MREPDSGNVSGSHTQVENHPRMVLKSLPGHRSEVTQISVRSYFYAVDSRERAGGMLASRTRKASQTTSAHVKKPVREVSQH